MITLKRVALAELAKVAGGVLANCSADGPTVASICSSSTACSGGSLFVAIPGRIVDGHQFIEDAFQHGAAAAIVSRSSALKSYPGIVVSDARKALSCLSSYLYGNPSNTMSVVGVTGTNGKTTVQWLVYQMLARAGLAALRIGTLGVTATDGFSEALPWGTPTPEVLHRVLAESRERGGEVCVMETTSQGLDQARVDHVAFDVGVFTNLTHDHLDYHGTLERYFLAKTRLFEILEGSATSDPIAVINTDDEYGRRLELELVDSRVAVVSIGESQSAAIRVVGFDQSQHGSVVTLDYEGDEYLIASGLVGAFNGHNVACAFAVGIALGFSPERAAELLTDAPVVPGRLQAIPGLASGVFIDYAHTPDALAQALRALRPLTRGRLWVVFGCGGDRDVGKRPLMGTIAQELADRVVVTSDNPRSEDPQRIVEDIVGSGLNAQAVELDRREAIFYALSHAGAEDVVLIAGKGHEEYQIIGDETLHFSDEEVVKEYIANSGNGY